MATIPLKEILQVTQYSHHHGELGIEATAQTFRYGNLVSLNGETPAKYAATAAGAPAAATKNKLAALAGRNLTLAASDFPYVTPFASMVFQISTGPIATTAGLLNAGTAYGYAIDATTGIGYLNLSDTTNLVWRLIQHNGSVIASQGGVAGDTGVRVYAQLIAL